MIFRYRMPSRALLRTTWCLSYFPHCFHRFGSVSGAGRKVFRVYPSALSASTKLVGNLCRTNNLIIDSVSPMPWSFSLFAMDIFRCHSIWLSIKHPFELLGYQWSMRQFNFTRRMHEYQKYVMPTTPSMQTLFGWAMGHYCERRDGCGFRHQVTADSSQSLVLPSVNSRLSCFRALR